MKVALAILFTCLSGCLQVKTWDGTVYECPSTLLKDVQTKLEAVCPQERLQEQLTPKP